MPAKKKGLNWKEVGQFVAALVQLFTIVSATFKKMKVDAELIEWLIGSGKKFFIKKLQEIGDEFLQQMAPILKGEIDTNIDPHLPFTGALIEKHARVGKVTIELRADGCLYIDGKKVILYRSERQMNGRVIKGHELRTEVDGQLVLSASILDFLKTHQEFFPAEWKEKDGNGNIICIFFWGTIYRSSVGSLYVRYLCWREGACYEDCLWLDYGWDSGNPAAVCASISLGLGYLDLLDPLNS